MKWLMRKMFASALAVFLLCVFTGFIVHLLEYMYFFIRWCLMGLHPVVIVILAIITTITIWRQDDEKEDTSDNTGNDPG